jgi:hypothetical protein
MQARGCPFPFIPVDSDQTDNINRSTAQRLDMCGSHEPQSSDSSFHLFHTGSAPLYFWMIKINSRIFPILVYSDK